MAEGALAFDEFVNLYNGFQLIFSLCLLVSDVRSMIFIDDLLCSEAAKYLQILVVTFTFCATNFNNPIKISVMMTGCFCIQNEKSS